MGQVASLADLVHSQNPLNDTPTTLPPGKVKPGRSFSLPIRVFYEDTDLGGIVYYANYLKFMERARTEFLRALGVNQSELLARERRMFVVKSANIEFVSPARFDDLLSVTAVVTTVRRASLQFTQECRVIENASATPVATDGDLVASADVVIACLDADSFKPCAVPGSLKMVLNH